MASCGILPAVVGLKLAFSLPFPIGERDMDEVKVVQGELGGSGNPRARGIVPKPGAALRTKCRTKIEI